MSSKDNQVRELQYKISKCQEETLEIRHKQNLLIIRCEHLKNSSKDIEFIRMIRLSEISRSEEEVQQLRRELEFKKKLESDVKDLIRNRQGHDDKNNKSMRKTLKEMQNMTENARQEVRAKSEILASLGISVTMKDPKVRYDVKEAKVMQTM